MIRDSDGWRVPRIGTHARIIYGLMKYGLNSNEIAKLTGYKLTSIRVVSARHGWFQAKRRGPISREWRNNPTVSWNDEGLNGIDRYS